MAKYAEKEAPLLERIIMQEGLERSKAEDWARDEITRLSEENARLRELLKPFEEAAGKLDDEPVGVGRQVGFTLKGCRAIRTAIREKRSFATEGGKDEN